MRTKRCTAGAVAAAVAMSAIPLVGLAGSASAADPVPPVADPTGPGSVCENAPADEPFTDVGPEDPAYAEIVCLFQADITMGTTDTTYAPNGTLTRRQMALFLTRTGEVAEANEIGDEVEALPVYDGIEDHSDIAAEQVAVRAAIGQLSQGGIAFGFDDGTYRPANDVSRRQMAKFIVRLVEHLTREALVPPAGDYFDDDDGDSGERELNQLAELGIFQGDGQGDVNPGDDLSRRQMALILLRMLQVLLSDGDITPIFETTPPPPTSPDAPLAPATASATASGTTVTLTYAESDTATADSYRIYRIVRPEGATACPDFDTAGSTGRDAYPSAPTASQADATPTSDGDSTITFTDPGLAATTNYCYAVTAVDGGVESTTGAQAAVLTGIAPATGPTITDVRASDGGTVGLVDSADVHQFIFSEPMAGTTDDPGQLYRMQDDDGTVAEIVCGTNANCVLQGAGTFNGVSYPTNQVMRVYVNGAVSVVTAGSEAGLQYPATITNVSAGWDNPAGDQLDLAGGSDVVINRDAISPTPAAPETVRPDMTGAVADVSADTVTVSYSEEVVCDPAAAGTLAQYGYTDSTTGTAATPISVQCDGTATAILTFADGIIASGDTDPRLTYTDDDSAVDANDIRDVQGNQAQSPETVFGTLQE